MSIQNRMGMVLILSGPSGAGKSTVYKKAFSRISGFEFSVSCTTRAPRPGEKDDVDYHFLSVEKFKELLSKDSFVESAEVHGNFYGTLKNELYSRVERGIDVLLDIDVQGAAQIRNVCKNDEILRNSCEFVFIMPQSMAVLEQRLRNRGTEEESVILRRLNNAECEIACASNYDYLLINSDLDETVQNFIGMIQTFRSAVKRLKGPIEK